MRKVLVTILFVSLISAVQCLGQQPLANEGLAGLYVRSIEQVLRLEPDEIDIGTAALIVSEQWSDMVAGRRYQERLDDMALEVRSRVEKKGIKARYKIVGEINDYLFDELGFKAVKEADDPNDLFLHSVMDHRRGYCLSLSILYLAIGERLGLPLYGVVVPGHFFVRYDDGRVRFNIETTSRGGTTSDEHYIDRFKVPKDGKSIYMSNLDKLQSLGCFFNNLGNVYRDIGDTEMARRALERAVQINPSLAESLLNLGNIYLEKGRVDDAIYRYQAAVRINPADAKAHNNLGNAYIRKNWVGDAIAEYTDAMRLEPNYVDAYRNAAAAYSKQGLYGKAKSTLQGAIERQPGNGGLYSALGDVYGQSGECEKAVSLYKRALGLKSNPAEAYRGLGLCYNKLGNSQAGIEAYKEALRIKPDMAEAMVGLGNVYFAKQQYNKSLEYYEKAAKLRSGDAAIQYNIGAAYLNTGKYDRAVRAYSRAIGIEPKMGDAYLGLAYAYYNQRRFEQALENAQKARALGVEVDEKLIEAIKSISE